MKLKKQTFGVVIASFLQLGLINCASVTSITNAKLGDFCLWSENCNSIPGAHCEDSRCVCLPHFVAINQSRCVAGSLLGFNCLVHQQCQIRVANSLCVDGICKCETKLVPHNRDTCLSGSSIGDVCISDIQCQLVNKLSHCKRLFRKGLGRCACLPGFSSHGTQVCGQTLGIDCTKDVECMSFDPHAHCTSRNSSIGICTCERGYTVSSDKSRCVATHRGIIDSPSSLGKQCRSSLQCQIRDPNSECKQGVCRCIEETSSCNIHNTGCHNDTFQCRSGWCISWYYVCDGKPNCDDGSDEDECVPFQCPHQVHQCSDGTCLPRSKLCNGRRDCVDGSDEKNCFNKCDSRAFRCGDGACLPHYSFCNAAISCRDLSDEIVSYCEGQSDSCPSGTFRCSNGRCRSTAILCSGRDGCGDASDENRCSVCRCPQPKN